ncbi:MAG: hypothetical protein HC933_10200 [Pleurocapsa sp. SU_196_0]|nr:hypothetical protein [Pleurocapsa sp. SU_196_0]
MELPGDSLGNSAVPPSDALLQNPALYEHWYRNLLQADGVPREVLVQTLVAQKSAVATLRAAMLLTSSDPDRSGELAKQSLLNGVGLVRVMSKAQLAILGILAAWRNVESQTVAATPFLDVLDGLLKETKQLGSTDRFALEIEVRLHSILADGYLLAENPDAARRHAAEAQLLAPVVGLNFLVSTSQYQLFRVYFFEANMDEAQKHLEHTSRNPDTTKLLAERVLFAKAQVAFALGDDNETLRCLDNFDIDTVNTKRSKTDPLRKWTMRFASGKVQSQDLSQVSPRAQVFDHAMEHLLNAQEVRPDRVQEVEQHFEQAQATMMIFCALLMDGKGNYNAYGPRTFPFA